MASKRIQKVDITRSAAYHAQQPGSAIAAPCVLTTYHTIGCTNCAFPISARSFSKTKFTFKKALLTILHAHYRN